VLVNTFDPNHWQYVYTYKKGGDAMIKQNVSLQFSNGLLQTINSTPLVALPKNP
jgi:outer membrane protein assembly factor BamE (lipoprotein component of BamABCDE complex)